MNPLSVIRRYLPRPALHREYRRRWQGVDDGGDPAAIPAGERFPFRCNLCGNCNAATLASLSREEPTCSGCGSNVRFRAMAGLVVREVLGRPIALPDLTPRPDIAGLGLSDARACAEPLAAKFAYQNTWYHAEPRLDIAAIDEAQVGRYDFLIASDVFEHVVPPVSRAFINARRLLKPGGVFIFSVPFTLEAETKEHYPDLHNWSVAESDGRWTLANRTRDGREQHFDGLVLDRKSVV